VSGASLALVLSVAGAFLGGVGTFLGYLYARSRNSRDDAKAETRAQAEAKAERAATHLLAQSAHDLATAGRSEVRGLRSEVTAQDSRVSILESKMEVFWRNVAFDVSKILHSPHPGWEGLDTLLEKFRDQTIASSEMAALEDHLRALVDGQWAPSEVSRADQVAASLLLRAIEQTRV
jgi:hypothetical protein